MPSAMDVVIYPNNIDSMSKLNNMSKDEFMKLSKDEIFDMLQGQLAQQPATGTENTLKPSKQGTKYNVKPMKSLVKEKIEYYEHKARKTEAVITYAKKPISIASMRNEELDTARTSRFKRDSSFLNLFGHRLKKLPGKRENIQITINADVENMIGDKSTITPKTYGPFKMTVPRLNNKDMYKYMIYTLPQNNFTILSTQAIANVGAK